MSVHNKWAAELGTHFDKFTWKRIYKACFKTTRDHNLIWTQYRILNRILGTKELLYKMKIKNDSLCRLCNTGTETIMHIFCSCPKSTAFINSIILWIVTIVKIQISTAPNDMILGYLNSDVDFIPKNIILMLLKSYIFNSAVLGRPLNIFSFQKKIINTLKEHEFSYKISLEEEKFNKIFARWKILFQNF